MMKSHPQQATRSLGLLLLLLALIASYCDAGQSSQTTFSTDHYHTCIIDKTTQEVSCSGSNSDGQCGVGSTFSTITYPTKVALSSVTEVCVGFIFSCFISAGRAYCTGSNAAGQLGANTQRTKSTSPLPVYGLPEATTVSHITCGTAHACALLATGAVYCWGWNYFGMLGVNDFVDRGNATAVTSFGTSGASAVAAGSYHTCIITTGGAMMCMGYNEYGQLGEGTTAYTRKVPTAVASPLTSGVTDMSLGEYHVCAIKAGAVYCFGYNAVTTLVQSASPTNYNTPQAISSVTSGAVRLSCSTKTQCVLLSSGSVKCWGDNTYCQTGNGNSNTPISASAATAWGSGVTGILEISAGYAISCMRFGDVDIKCVGSGGPNPLASNPQCTPLAALFATNAPTPAPTSVPSASPTRSPSSSKPTRSPSKSPSKSPTFTSPTRSPSTSSPTRSPTSTTAGPTTSPARVVVSTKMPSSVAPSRSPTTSSRTNSAHDGFARSPVLITIMLLMVVCIVGA